MKCPFRVRSVKGGTESVECARTDGNIQTKRLKKNSPRIWELIRQTTV